MKKESEKAGRLRRPDRKCDVLPSLQEKARRMRVKAFKMSERYAEEYGFDIQAMTGRDQRASIVAQRRVIAKLLRADGFSFPAISRALNRDHRTIISYFEKTTLSEIALRRELSARGQTKTGKAAS